MRATWAGYPEVSSGRVLVRFAVGVPANTSAAERQALLVESRAHADAVLLDTVGRSSVYAPLISTYRWLQHAVVAHPDARFVGKLDDDVYVHVPELAAQLAAVDAAALRHVYMGSFFATSWDPAAMTHVGSAYTVRGAKHLASAHCDANASKAAKRCVGPFVSTTGSCQLLSASVARGLADSPAAQADIEEAARRARELEATLALPEARRRELKPRRKRVFEDAWMGYAAAHLLPQALSRALTTVAIDRFGFVFDQDGWTLSNYTMIAHNRRKKPERIAAAHEHALAHHISTSSNATLRCARARGAPADRPPNACAFWRPKPAPAANFRLVNFNSVPQRGALNGAATRMNARIALLQARRAEFGAEMTPAAESARR